MCSECFNESEHKNHNYKMSTTDGNGFCDCGDPEAFTRFHLCRTHEEASRNGVSAKDVLETFPIDLRRRTKELLTIVSQKFAFILYLYGFVYKFKIYNLYLNILVYFCFLLICLHSSLFCIHIFCLSLSLFTLDTLNNRFAYNMKIDTF